MDKTDCVLIVDDDPEIRRLLVDYLARNGFEAVAARDGREMWQALDRHAIDLVVLDLMLPDTDGLTLCRELRAKSNLPVLMLTALGEETDRIVGIEMGADDYLVKPFSPRELVARIKAVLRRPRSTNRVPTPAGLVIDEPRHDVRVDGTAIELTATEFGILAVLARDPGLVVSRTALLDRVWGSEFVADAHLVDVHVANLRRKLGDDPTAPRFIETVRAVGYRLMVS